MQFINPGNRFARERDDDITLAQTGPARGTAGFNSRHEHAEIRREPVKPHDPPMDGNVLANDPDPTAADATFPDQPCRHEFGRVAGDGKTDSLRGQNDRRVHADDLTARIDQRPAGIAGIQRRVGLDDIVNQPPGLGERIERPSALTTPAVTVC